MAGSSLRYFVHRLSRVCQNATNGNSGATPRYTCPTAPGAGVDLKRPASGTVERGHLLDDAREGHRINLQTAELNSSS
jgi:hypothetical protein